MTYDRFLTRIWDVENKVMLYNHVEDYIGLINGEFHQVYKHVSNYDYREVIKHRLGDLYIPMQCTGLKDKKHKLIYEGDLIDTYRAGVNEIKFQEDEALFLGISIENHIRCRLNQFKTKEIVGNIYQNPGLLTQKEQNDE